MVVMVFKNIYLNNSRTKYLQNIFPKNKYSQIKDKVKSTTKKKTFSINLQGKVAFII